MTTAGYNTMRRVALIISILCATVMLTGSEALCLEVFIPSARAIPGQSVDIPVVIDKVDNLAGIKIVITYDHHVLTFVTADKSKETSSLMHVVNSKNPGVLIIVMAGAKGVGGENLPLVTMRFNVRKQIPEALKQTKLAITELQLMSDQLKELKSTITIKPIEIVHDPVKIP